jgi:F-box-like
VKRIDILPDDILLGIFDFYVDMNLLYGGKTEIEAWQSLVHVCRRWRRLVLESPRRLDLQLYCTPETPARATLDVWPALPLIVEGIMVISSGTDNIVAALGQAAQSNHVCQVDLHLADWQWEKVLAPMQVSFPELTVMQLSSHGETPPVIPDSFLGGSAPRLRTFDLDGIPFPGLPNLLFSATHLVYLRLVNIPHSGYISPEAIVAPLSVLSSLETLSLGFQSPQSRPDWESRSPPPLKHSILPALRRLHFKGITEYLEELVARIDTPQLDLMHINFFNQIDFNCPRLAQFINCTPTLRARNEAHLQFDDSTVSVTLRYQTSTLSFCNLLIINISCREPDWQLSSIEQVCNSSLHHPLSTAEDLYIEHRYSELVWKNDAIETTLWLEFLPPFAAVKNLYLSRESAPGIAAALQELIGGRITEVLPSLQNIFVKGLKPSGPLQENFGQFVAARQLSGHPIAISVWDKDSDTESM